LLVCSQRERPFGWPVPKRGRNWGHQRICRLRRDTWQPDDVWHQPGGGSVPSRATATFRRVPARNAGPQRRDRQL